MTQHWDPEHWIPACAGIMVIKTDQGKMSIILLGGVIPTMEHTRITPPLRGSR